MVDDVIKRIRFWLRSGGRWSPSRSGEPRGSYYTRALAELSEDKNEELWARCLVDADFDEKRASSLYVDTVARRAEEADQGLSRELHDAERGDARAQLKLAIRYGKGEGVRQNPIVGFALLTLAADHGGKEAKWLHHEVAEMLSPEQVAEGQRLAAQWRVGTPLPSCSDVTTWP